MKTLYDGAKAAENYNSARTLPTTTQQMWINMLDAVIRPFAPKRIMDLGAGTGRFSTYLRDTFAATVIGVEPSETMLASAKRDIPGEWLKGSAESIPLGDKSVDLIWMSQAFHHIRDYDRALCQIKRTLVPGGYFAIRNGTIENNNSIDWLKCFPEALKFDEQRGHTQRDLLRLVIDHGFSCTWWATINQFTAPSYADYFPRIAKRGLSSLIAISDDDFTKGLRKLEQWTKDQSPHEPVFEPVDLFVFKLDT